MPAQPLPASLTFPFSCSRRPPPAPPASQAAFPAGWRATSLPPTVSRRCSPALTGRASPPAVGLRVPPRPGAATHLSLSCSPAPSSVPFHPHVGLMLCLNFSSPAESVTLSHRRQNIRYQIVPSLINNLELQLQTRPGKLEISHCFRQRHLHNRIRCVREGPAPPGGARIHTCKRTLLLLAMNCSPPTTGGVSAPRTTHTRVTQWSVPPSITPWDFSTPRVTDESLNMLLPSRARLDWRIGKVTEARTGKVAENVGEHHLLFVVERRRRGVLLRSPRTAARGPSVAVDVPSTPTGSGAGGHQWLSRS